MTTLYFWRETMPLPSTPSSLVRRLDLGGDDVMGLDDLPIREMIDVLKSHFVGGKESAGLWRWQSDAASLQASWTWQYLRLDLEQISDEHRDQLLELAQRFHCTVYDSGLDLKLNS
jgi:hypothetical protein